MPPIRSSLVFVSVLAVSALVPIAALSSPLAASALRGRSPLPVFNYCSLTLLIIMEESTTRFVKRTELKLHKNVDRLIRFDDAEKFSTDNHDKHRYVAATYHLDKETQTKSGSLQLVTVDGEKVETFGEPLELGYGVLSIKREESGLWSIGGSDGKIHLIEGKVGENGIEVKEVSEYTSKDELGSINVCLMHDTTKEKIAGCY